MELHGTVRGKNHFLQAYCGLILALASQEPRAQRAQYPRLWKGVRWGPYTPGAGLRASASAWLFPASAQSSRNTTTSPQKHQPSVHLSALPEVAQGPQPIPRRAVISRSHFHFAELKTKPKHALLWVLSCRVLRACFLFCLNRFRSEAQTQLRHLCSAPQGLSHPEGPRSGWRWGR